MKYLANEQLITIRPDWPGTPVDAKGRFINLDRPFLPSFGKVLQWQLTPNPQKAEKKVDDWLPNVRTDGTFLSETIDSLTWLGHATFLIRLGGKTFLTDPVFYRASPFVKRLILLPVAPERLRGIDYLLLSHGHMDHCDEQSLRLLARQNPGMQVLTGLRMGALIAPWMPDMPVREAGWYQSYAMDTASPRVFFLPARHWYKRTLFDDNQRLWGSFVLQTAERTLYFSGDSGYGSHFYEMREQFPNPHVCLMGVGAYAPPFMMRDSHMSPEEAVRGFHDLGGQTFIPMHYGTFDLSDEPLGEPVRWLRRLEVSGQIKGQLKIPDVGEIVAF